VETLCESPDNGVTCRIESGLDGGIPLIKLQALETSLFSALLVPSLE
jgi:hypothetical protein